MKHLNIFFEAAKEAIEKDRYGLAYEIRFTKSMFVWEQMRFKAFRVFVKPTSVFVFSLVEFHDFYRKKCFTLSTKPLSSNEIAKALYEQPYFIGYVRGIKSRFKEKMGSGYAIDMQKFINQKNNIMSNTNNEANYTDVVADQSQSNQMMQHGMYVRNGFISSIDDEGKSVTFPIPAQKVKEFLSIVL